VVCRDLSTTEPTTVQSLSCFNGILDFFETNIDLSLFSTASVSILASEQNHQNRERDKLTWDSLTTKIVTTLPYLSSHSDLTSSASSRSQSRSVSSSGLKASFIKLGVAEKSDYGKREKRRSGFLHVASRILRNVRTEPANERRRQSYISRQRSNEKYSHRLRRKFGTFIYSCKFLH